MPNTFNFLLSDFLVTDLSARYGIDYYVDEKKLIVPLSSTWMANITSINTTNKGLCSLDLTRSPRLSSFTVIEPRLRIFRPPSTNSSFLCAFNLKTYSMSLTGSRYRNITLIDCDELRNLDLTRVSNLVTLNVINCDKLSSVDISENTFNTRVTSIFINLYGNNLNNTSINDVYGSLLSGYYLGDGNYRDTYLNICNPVTGSFTRFAPISSIGIIINISQCFPGPQFIVYAEKD